MQQQNQLVNLQQNERSTILSNFTDYLNKQKHNKDNLSSLINIAGCWFNELLDGFEKLAKYYPSSIWSAFGIVRQGGTFSAVRDGKSYCEIVFEAYYQEGINSTSSKFINLMDVYFSLIIKNLNQFFSKPYSVFKGFFPFQPKQSGVEMICRIRRQDGSIVFATNPAHSFLGADQDAQKKIRQRIAEVKKAGALIYLDSALEQVAQKKFLALIDGKEPHAEDDFYGCDGKKIFDFLVENKKDFQNNLAIDNCSISLLVGERIEFIMSTSPCNECQQYFRALRKLLNDNHINIPILIFAKTPYNQEEPDFSIFSVAYDMSYIRLPFKWKIKNEPLQLTEKISPGLGSLLPEYKTILILNVFGEALLPRLIENPIIITSFFHSLLQFHIIEKRDVITSHLFLDWLKFYYVNVVTSLPYDFSNTTIKEIMSPESYKTINLPFMKSGFFAVSEIKEFQGYLRYAHKKDNALLFFLRLFQYWHASLYEHLKSREDYDKEALPEKVEQLLTHITGYLFWNVDTVPKNLIKEEDDFQGGKVLTAFDAETCEFRGLINLLADAIHYARITTKYKRNILNQTLTRLGNDSYKQTDEEMAVTVYKTKKAISELCYDKATNNWKMDKLESIHRDFRERKLSDELKACMEKQSLPRKEEDKNLKRWFSQGQVFGDHIGLTPDDTQENRNSKEFDVAHPDYAYPEICYAVKENWRDFLSYLEGEFTEKVKKKSYQLNIIVLSKEKFVLQFKQLIVGNRSVENLNKERDRVCEIFMTYLILLTSRQNNLKLHSDGFDIWLMASPKLIRNWIQYFSNLSIINTMYISPDVGMNIFQWQEYLESNNDTETESDTEAELEELEPNSVEPIFVENENNWGVLSVRSLYKYAFCFFDTKTLETARLVSKNSYNISKEIEKERENNTRKFIRGN
jgi:hypothetical protein